MEFLSQLEPELSLTANCLQVLGFALLLIGLLWKWIKRDSEGKKAQHIIVNVYLGVDANMETRKVPEACTVIQSSE